ncbi:MAG: FAD-dependent monooxygenase [Gemmatimonadota bacterium]
MSGERSRLDADVVVVGAGPAGASAATWLARAGVAVLLVDRAVFPRAKPCGDCLSPAATDVLGRLGVLDAVLAHAPGRLRGWRLRSPSGAALPVPFPPGANGLVIERRALDAMLVAGARAAGAQMLDGVRVVDLVAGGPGEVLGVRTIGGDGKRRELRCRAVVGADGLRSVIATRLGVVRRPAKLRKFSLTAHLPALAGADRSAAGSGRHVGSLCLGDGLCVGAAPVAARSASEGPQSPRWNVTLVADADRFGRLAARDPYAFYREAVGAVAGRERPYSWPGGRPTLLASGPFDRPVRAVAGRGWALVGDAAGYYDPFTGQGIYQALAGGELLAGRLAAALFARRRGVVYPSGWARDHRRITAAARWLQRVIEAVVSRPRFCDEVFGRLADSRRLSRALGAVTGDLESAYSLLRPDRIGALAATLVARPSPHHRRGSRAARSVTLPSEPLGADP